MVYVALLRGINVGGNNKIDMKLLRKTVEQAGMRSVMTYINTGNIIFIDDQQDTLQIAKVLEEAIHTDFGLQIKVLVRSLDDMRNVIATLPESWSNDQAMKSDVLFLWNECDNESVLDQLESKPEVDTLLYVPGAVLWSIDRKNATRSGMSKIVGTKLYRQMTIRNVNTTRKIVELMLKVEQDAVKNK